MWRRYSIPRTQNVDEQNMLEGAPPTMKAWMRSVLKNATHCIENRLRLGARFASGGRGPMQWLALAHLSKRLAFCLARVPIIYIITYIPVDYARDGAKITAATWGSITHFNAMADHPS